MLLAALFPAAPTNAPDLQQVDGSKMVKIEYCWIKEKTRVRKKQNPRIYGDRANGKLTYFAKPARHKEYK